MLPQVDIIYGGFPCQDISVAGKQVGLGGQRSGLFFEIIRLARETRAEWLFLENVSNIRTKGLGRVLKELDAGGFDCRWGLLSAADVGANHKRERWFLLAHSRSVECTTGTEKQRAIREVPENGPIDDNASRSSVALADADDAGQRISMPDKPPQDSGSGTFEGSSDVADSTNKQGGGLLVSGLRSDISATGDGGRQASWWSIEPSVGRVAHGIPKRVDRLRALGNAVVPAQAREAFERLMGLKGDK
jgi:DNA (cytosine-5)-methyltransferase 1